MLLDSSCPCIRICPCHLILVCLRALKSSHRAELYQCSSFSFCINSFGHLCATAHAWSTLTWHRTHLSNLLKIFSQSQHRTCTGRLCLITADYLLSFWSPLQGGFIDCEQCLPSVVHSPFQKISVSNSFGHSLILHTHHFRSRTLQPPHHMLRNLLHQKEISDSSSPNLTLT